MNRNIYNISAESSAVFLSSSSPLLSPLSALLPTETFPTSFYRHALRFIFLSLSLSLFFILSISPLTNKQVSRELLLDSEKGHRPVWPLRRPELHCDWLEHCSRSSHECETGIACLRQKHRASRQLLSPRGEDCEMENMK